MTKSVRVENADTSSFRLAVETWDKGINGAPDALAHTEVLEHPTSMATPYVTSSRYLVIRELL